jgi:hypothetical protein
MNIRHDRIVVKGRYAAVHIPVECELVPYQPPAVLPGLRHQSRRDVITEAFDAHADVGCGRLHWIAAGNRAELLQPLQGLQLCHVAGHDANHARQNRMLAASLGGTSPGSMLRNRMVPSPAMLAQY